MNPLKEILKAAKERDKSLVQYFLNLKLFSYRQAQVYCECMGNPYASDFIREQAHCKGCGNIVDRWDYSVPTCGSCRFVEAMARIEFGPRVKVTIHKAENIA